MPIAETRLELCQVSKLHQCVRERNFEQIKKLVASGVPRLINYNEPNEGDTALNIAARANDVGMIDFLLDVKIGGHPDVCDFKGQSAIMVAAQYGHVESLKKLLDNHANIDAVDLKGKNILFYCFAVCTERHRKCIDLCFEHSVDVNRKTANGQTPVYEACRNAEQNAEVISVLINDKGAEVNIMDKETGRTAVHEAAKSGGDEALKLLLTGGANPHVVDTENAIHPVHEAAKGGHLECLKVLSAFGANFDQVDKLQCSPIHYAAAKGAHFCVKFLAQRGSNPKMKNVSGQFPKMIAKDLGHKEALKECKKAEKTFGKKMNNAEPWAIALYDLVQVQKEDVVKVFEAAEEEEIQKLAALRKAAESNEIEAEKASPDAVKKGRLPKERFVDILTNNLQLPLPNEAIAKLVSVHMKDGKEVDYNDFINGKKYVNKNYLMTAFVKKEKKKKGGKGKKGKPKKPPFPICTKEPGERTDGGNPPVMFVEKHSHFTDFSRFDRDNPPKNPLQDDSQWYVQPIETTYVDIGSAVRSNDYNTLTNAFLKGYSVDTRDRFYKTPLMIAATQSNIDLCKFLLENGADPNAKDNFKWTPLHFACQAGIRDLVELLIDRGANMNVQALNGGTPMNRAIESSKIDVVQLLIERGANVQVENKKGWNLVDVACQWADPTVYDAVKVKLDSMEPKKDAKKKPPTANAKKKKSAGKSFTGDDPPVQVPDKERRDSILRAASVLAKTLEQREDITYRPLHVWTKMPTTSELIQQREKRRVRFNWEVDFPDYEMPFHQNVTKRCELQGGVEG